MPMPTAGPRKRSKAKAGRSRSRGRLLAKRVMGKAAFAQIQDVSGRIQLFLQSATLGATYDAFKGWDVGDIVAATGTLMRTKTGELSVRADSLRLLTKSLRPLPDKWHGLSDVEQRYRQRYVDLIVTPEARAVFVQRSRDHRRDAALARCAALPRSRDADDALHRRRRDGQAVHHAPQRAGPGPVPARRARAVPQASGGRRLRAGVRDQPQLPQRRRSVRGTTPNSRCSSCTRPMRRTTKSWTSPKP